MTQTKIDQALIIFVRKPELGKVKTRLAKTIGNEAALSIYTQVLNHTLNVAFQLKMKSYIFFTPEIYHDPIWGDAQFEKKLQIEGNLGTKIKDAFSTVLQKHDQAIILGSDCLYVGPELIKKACAALHKEDVVIGPAKDGGYYLLGLKAEEAQLFENITWSTSKVLEETIIKIKEAKLSYALLDTYSDIDFEEDWLKQKHLLNRSEPIYHVVNINDWNAQSKNETFIAGGYPTEGFIHCCYEHQFKHVLSNYFDPNAELMILKLDPKAIGKLLIVENAGTKGDFPHIYGPIQKDWILEKRIIINDLNRLL